MEMENDLQHSIIGSLQQYSRVLDAWQQDENNISTLVKMAEHMSHTLSSGGKLLVCGNGGSLCQAQHFAEELTGRFRDDREPLCAIALADASHITCVGNDYGFEDIFSRSITAYGRSGDGLILLSTSGNSANLIKAAEAAKAQSLTTYALLGRNGGKLKGMCDFELIIDAQTSDVIQNMHMAIIHLFIESIERMMFPNNYI